MSRKSIIGLSIFIIFGFIAILSSPQPSIDDFIGLAGATAIIIFFILRKKHNQNPNSEHCPFCGVIFDHTPKGGDICKDCGNSYIEHPFKHARMPRCRQEAVANHELVGTLSYSEPVKKIPQALKSIEQLNEELKEAARYRHWQHYASIKLDIAIKQCKQEDFEESLKSYMLIAYFNACYANDHSGFPKNPKNDALMKDAGFDKPSKSLYMTTYEYRCIRELNLSKWGIERRFNQLELPKARYPFTLKEVFPSYMKSYVEGIKRYSKFYNKK